MRKVSIRIVELTARDACQSHRPNSIGRAFDCENCALAHQQGSYWAQAGGYGVTVKVTDFVMPKVPEIVTVFVAFTFLVLTVKVALVAPEATVTLVATLAKLPALDRVTATPPAGAGAFSATVPAEELPPVSTEGFKKMDVRNNAIV